MVALVALLGLSLFMLWLEWRVNKWLRARMKVREDAWLKAERAAYIQTMRVVHDITQARFEEVRQELEDD
jgi:hypothetical protein